MPIHKGLNGAKFILSLMVIVLFAYMMVYADKFETQEPVAVINPLFVQENSSDLATIDLRTVEIVAVEGNEVWVLQYVVQAGDTLWGIATKFGTTISHLKKINNIGNTPIRPWQKLIVTDEQEGFVYTMKNKTTIRVFAELYGLNLEDLMTLNYIQDDTEILQEWQEVFINISDRDAKNKWLQEPDPIYVPRPVVAKKPTITTSSSNASRRSTTASNPTAARSSWGSSSNTSNGKDGIIAKWTFNEKVSNSFYAWQCTWYAAIISPGIFWPVVDGKQNRPFWGNANQRYKNAKAAGYSVGQSPRVWAVVVYSRLRSSAGHVAVVREVHSADGKMIVEDMNYAGKFIVTKRREDIDRDGIIWYIYP